MIGDDVPVFYRVAITRRTLPPFNPSHHHPPMDLHVFFLPFLAPGHMIPMVDLAHLFAARGAKASIVTTTANVALIHPTVDLANSGANFSHDIQILPVRFPSAESGIPEGHENLIKFNDPGITPEFFAAVGLLEAPFRLLLQAHRPDAVVADTLFSWASDLAKEFGIPRLTFHGSSTFCTIALGALYGVKLEESEQPFDVHGLPHRIQFTWSQLPNFLRQPMESFKRVGDAHRASYGTIFNSFYEFETEYIDLMRMASGNKIWHLGPLSLYPREENEKAVRGNRASVDAHDAHECWKWLDSKKQGSVLYVCFGSLGRSTKTQLREIATGLGDSGHPFIWVVKDSSEPAEWLPEGFEGTVIGEGKGLIIRGWAPQLLILNHKAVGGFMTHCGWNSCVEAVSAGLPMATWPLFAEQFANEKLVVDVRGIGVSMGVKVCSNSEEERELVVAERIEKAVGELMGGGEGAEERRKRARQLQAMARAAIAEGGSSFAEASRLLDELQSLKASQLIGQTNFM